MTAAAAVAATITRIRYRYASNPMGTLPSMDSPAASGTTTATIAVAADSAAITAACASSPGRSAPRVTGSSPVMAEDRQRTSRAQSCSGPGEFITSSQFRRVVPLCPNMLRAH